MKTKIFKWPLLMSIGLVAFSTGCANASQTFELAKVTLSASTLEIGVGDVTRITVSHSKGYDAELRWFTSDPNVAYAEGNYVFGIGEGVATITASYGGGYADCRVTVGEGGGSTTTPTIVLSRTTLTIAEDQSGMFNVTRVYPEDTTITDFRVSDTSVIEVTAKDETKMEYVVNALKAGAATITVTGSNGISRVCAVTVTGKATPGAGGNIAVDTNLNYSGELLIGSPQAQRSFMEGLLQEFNDFTGSNIKFTVIDFEESNGTGGYSNAKSMPAVFPYASDQTMDLSQFKALSKVPNTDREWIETNMGEEAIKAAEYNGVVGYPFAADNGLVMFYNKDLLEPELKEGETPSNITIDRILEIANEKDYEVNYPLSDGFYVAPALMTYSPNHKSLYELTGSSTGYKSSASFNSEAGKLGAALVHKIATNPSVRNAKSAPRGDVLVTITDSSNVRDFKKQMSTYCAAPLPYADANKTTRIGSFLGYKFYGVNMQLDETSKKMAFNVAKFLVSEYVQTKRYQTYNVRPTLTTSTKLDELTANEPHINAMKEQANNGKIALKAVSLALWSQAGTAYTDIKALGNYPVESLDKYVPILSQMDSQLTVNK